MFKSQNVSLHNLKNDGAQLKRWVGLIHIT